MRTLRSIKAILIALLLLPFILQAVIIELTPVLPYLLVGFLVITVVWAVGRFGPP